MDSGYSALQRLTTFSHEHTKCISCERSKDGREISVTHFMIMHFKASRGQLSQNASFKSDEHLPLFYLQAFTLSTRARLSNLSAFRSVLVGMG